MKLKIFLFLLMAIFLCGNVAHAKKVRRHVKQTSKSLKSQKKHSDKLEAKSLRIKGKKKRLKYVAPPVNELQVEEMPDVLPIPDYIIDQIAKGNLEEAARNLRTEQPSNKTLNLLKEVQKILIYKRDGKITDPDKHKFYQNIGIAYHNLFLFLKRHDVYNEDYYKSAVKYYRKAETSSKLEKTEANILIAAITAASGEKEKAEKIFSKIDTASVQADANRSEYLATYYAAVGDKENAIIALNRAHELNREQIELWVRIGDDFAAIENEPEFKDMLSSWEDEPEEDADKVELSLPKAKKPKLK